MSSPSAPGKVVIVDTHEGYRRTLAGLLAELEVGSVIPVSSANELLGALVAEPALACALISHDLPGDAPRGAAEALWLLAPGTPVIFYTARSGGTIDEAAWPAPVALLCKPLRSWDLKSTLVRLGRRKPVMKPGPALPFDL